MKPGGALAYTFWHWRRPTVDRAVYEERHRAFHAALNGNAPPGFQSSTSGRCAGMPWANGGAEAYQDRYLVDGWGRFDALETGAITGAREASHAAIAAAAGGGAAGIYGVRLGAPPAVARYAYWFSKPDGMSYAQLDEASRPLAGDGAVLWMRRMVLGPTPEFCLETELPVTLPPRFSVLTLTFTPIWPALPHHR